MASLRHREHLSRTIVVVVVVVVCSTECCSCVAVVIPSYFYVLSCLGDYFIETSLPELLSRRPSNRTFDDIVETNK